MAAPWQSSNSANKLHSAPGQYVLAPASMQEAIQRLVKEDIDRMHAEIPELTHTQLTSIESELMSLRKRDPIVVGQEELALKRLLTPSQFSKWQESLIKQRRLESEDFAHTKLRDVRRVLPNLSEEQSDMVFQKFGQEFLTPLRSDKEILAEILSPQQYELWISKQTFR